MALSTTATISGLPAEIIAEIFWKLLGSFDDSENDSEDQFHKRAKWHYGCLARLCLTCKRWRNVAEHAASFWTLLSSSIPKPVRTKIRRLSGNLPLDVTHDHQSDDMEARSPETEGLMPKDMVDAFPRWKTATLRFEDVEDVPPEIYGCSSHQLKKLVLRIDALLKETWRGLLGGNTISLRHLYLAGAEFLFPTSSLPSLRVLHVNGFFEPSSGPITILEALRSTQVLEKLTLDFGGSEPENAAAWSAERLQTIGLIELPHLKELHLHMEAGFCISLLQHITSTSRNHLDVGVSFEVEQPPRVAELRQALTRFLPCIHRAVEASSRADLSITLSTVIWETIRVNTDPAAPHTFSLRLSFRDEWIPEAFQWLGDLVAPFSQNDPFVTINLRTGLPIYTPRPFPSSALDGWIQSILLMLCVCTLDLWGLSIPHSNFLDWLSEPIDVPGESPRWPLASLKRLRTQPGRSSPLELLHLLKVRQGQDPESSYLVPPARLAEFVLYVGTRGLSEEWAEHIPAIQEALKPGQLGLQ